MYGHDPKSYRAEGFGAKAGTLFLLNMFKYCDKTIPISGGFKFYCDNEGLLKKLVVFRSYENAAQATCLHSEWDIVSAIHTLHKEFQILPEIFHVPSHQDDHHRIQDLDLPTQMNIEADSLATKALQDGTSQPIVPFDPSCGAMLSINGRAITRNLEATVQRHEHTAPLQEYYCTRFGWSKETLASIDWDIYAMVYTKFQRTRTFFSKFGWKQLPTGGRLHKWTPSFDHRCPSCNQEFETDDHMFQCSHIHRDHWRKDLLRTITDTFSSFLDPELLTILKIGLTSFFTDSSPEFQVRFPTQGTTAHYLPLIEQQNLIGWDQLMRGKMGKLWGPKQHAFAKRYDLTEVSKRWQNRLVRLFANASFRLWEIRNGCRHGIDAATKQLAQQEQAHRELRILYTFRTQVLQQDRGLFQETIEAHLSETTSQIRTWITHNRKLLLHSVKVAKAQMILNTQHLQSFFPRVATIRSTVPAPRAREHIRYHTTRLAAHFPTISMLRSTSRRRQQSVAKKRFNTPDMSCFYNPDALEHAQLPPIDENTPSQTTSPQRRQIRRRRHNIIHLYPDHPG